MPVKSNADSAWDRAGVPARLADCRLAGSPQERHYPELVKRLTAPPSPYVAPVEGHGWWDQSWMFWGPVGRGKSGLAAALAWQWVDPAWGDPAMVVWHSVPALLAELRHSYGTTGYQRRYRQHSEFAILADCRTADLLILDDLGAEHVNGSGWVEEKLYQIVSARHEGRSPMVITSNLPLVGQGGTDGLMERIGERIAWRILEQCGPDNIVHLDGPNLRASGARS